MLACVLVLFSLFCISLASQDLTLSASNSSSANLFPSKENHPIVDAFKLCDQEKVIALLGEDPKLLEFLNWSPFLGLLSLSESNQCSALLSHILVTTDVPVEIMNQALSSAVSFDQLDSAKLILKSMLESKKSLESTVFQVICKSENTGMLLEYILKVGMDAYDLVQGAIVAFASGQTVNMNLLLSKLDGKQMIPLFYSVVNHIKVNGCPGTLGEMLKNPFFLDFVLKYKVDMKILIGQMVDRALEAKESKEFIRAIDVLLRIPELAKEACAQDFLYQSISKAHVGLGTVVRRRCPAILQDLDSQHFVVAMEMDDASEVFDAFADIFVTSAADLEACFHAALKLLDREIICKMYEWAKTNDYMVSLEARLGMVNKALWLTGVPATFNRPAQTERLQKIEAEIVANRKKLLSFSLVLSQEFDLEKVRRAYEVEEAIRKGQAEIAAMTMTRSRATTVVALRRRLWTLVATEGIPVKRLKAIVRNHHLDELKTYLEKYSTN